MDINIAEFIEICAHYYDQNWSECLSSSPLHDISVKILTASCLAGKQVAEAMENNAAAFAVSDLAKFVVSANEELDCYIQTEIGQHVLSEDKPRRMHK